MRSDGSLECWGLESRSRDPPPGDFSAFAVGDENFTIGLRPDSTIECWGNNSFGQCNAPKGAFTSIGAGYYHSIGLRTDGSVECWGWNIVGQCNAPAGIFTGIAGGGYHTVAIAADISDDDADGIPGWLDNCPDAFNPEQGDCDADGIGDTCDTAFEDCNSNGLCDVDDVLSGSSHDCNDNGVPDECEDGTLSLTTGDMGAFGLNEPADGILAGAPPSLADVAVKLRVIADLGSVTEYATLSIGGMQYGGLLLQTNGLDCPVDPQQVELVVPRDDWNTFVDSYAGMIPVVVSGSTLVDPLQCLNGYAEVTVQYPPLAYDCDLNGVSDLCEIADGSADCDLDGVVDACAIADELVTDCNDNGIPDSCDVANGAWDDDGDLLPDECEYALGDFDLDGAITFTDLLVLLGLWGAPDPVIGDLDGDGLVGFNDLLLLLSRWGPAP